MKGIEQYLFEKFHLKSLNIECFRRTSKYCMLLKCYSLTIVKSSLKILVISLFTSVNDPILPSSYVKY